MNRLPHPSRRYLLPGMLLVLILAPPSVYIHTLRAPFIFDDLPCIANNRTLTSLWPQDVPTGLERRPVGRLSFALNYVVGELNVRGYRALNLAIHLAAGLILFDLVRRTLRLDPLRPDYARAAPYLAFAVAILWAMHPLQTQSVTYIIQRLESMMGLFFLICVYSVLRGSQSSRPGPWYAAAVAAFWLGMGTKEVMVAAAVVVPLYDRIFLSDSWSAVFRRRWPLYLAFVPALAAMGVALARSFASRGPGPGFGFEPATPLEYLGTQPGVILHYLRLSFWPDSLCLDYQWPIARTKSEILVPGAVIAGLLAASLLLLWKRPRIGFLAVSFFLILAPTSSIMPIGDQAFEHRMYLPLAAVIVLVVVGVYEAWRRVAPRLAVIPLAVLATVVAAFGYQTAMRNHDYRSEFAIWKDTAEKSPHNPRAQNNLGTKYHEAGDIGRAMACYAKAIELQHDYPDPYYNRAHAFHKMGKLDLALRDYNLAIHHRPNYAHAIYNRGVLYEQVEELDLALKDFSRALELAPNLAMAYYHRGNTYRNLDRPDEALSDYTRAIELNSGYVEAYNNRAVLYFDQKQYGRARADVKMVEALGGQLHPEFMKALEAAESP